MNARNHSPLLVAWISEGNPARVRKTADILDVVFLDAVRAAQKLAGMWASRYDVGAVLDGNGEWVRAFHHPQHGHYPERPEPIIPEKIVLAKARRLIRRGVLDGCYCGCRGDFEIPKVPMRPAERRRAAVEAFTTGQPFDYPKAPHGWVTSGSFTFKAPRTGTPADYDRIRNLFSKEGSR